MELKEKANRLMDNFRSYAYDIGASDNSFSKECAIIAVKNEYHSNRELLFNLKSSGIEINEKVYLSRLQGLIDEEKLLIEEIQKL